jgi:hypothetical protein
MKLLSKGESAFVLLVILCFGAAATALVRDITGTAELRGTKVGTITWKDRYAEQRQEGSGLWVAAVRDGPVYNHDTIRTGENSSATIRLSNDTVISLDAGSMVYVRVDAATDRATISIKGGSIKVAQGEKAAPVELETKSGSIALEKGAVRITGDETKATVRAETPAATIVSSGGTEAITLDAASNFDVANREVVAAPVSITAPGQNEYLVAAEKKAEVVFAWSPADKPLRVTIARDSAFRKPVLEGETLASGAVQILAEGRYWWRVEETGEIRSFTVAEGGACAPVSPVGKSFLKAGSLVSVPFAWTKRGNADSYRVDVFAEGAGDNPILQRTVTQRTTMIDIPDEGAYSWSVTAFYGPNRVAYSSEKERFSIVGASLAAPTAPTIARGIASWTPVEGAEAYEIRVSPEETGVPAQYGAIVNASYASLKNAVSTGLWFVSIRSKAGSLTSEWSSPAKYELLPPQPLSISAPGNGAMVDGASGKVALSWVDRNDGNRYRVTISRSADLTNPAAEIAPYRPTCQFTLPKGERGGLYYWKVALLDAAGAPVSESPVSSFRIREPIPAPEQVSPVNGQQLDINALSALRLEWKPVADASFYTARLYRMTAGIPQSIGSWKSVDPIVTITDFTKLALDSFSWEVVAVKTEEDGSETRSAPAKSYFKIVQTRVLSAPSIKIMKSRGAF